MIEKLTISVSFSEVEEAHVGNYFRLSEMSGKFLIIQKPDNTFHFLCTNDCDIVSICQSFPDFVTFLSSKIRMPDFHQYRQIQG